MKGPKSEYSSERILSILRKDKRQDFQVLTRLENIVKDKPHPKSNLKLKQTKLKMFRNPGEQGKLMQPCIDQEELEDIPKVFTKLISELGFEKRQNNNSKSLNQDNQQNKKKRINRYANSFVGGPQNFSKAQEIYFKLEKDRLKAKKFKKMYKKSKNLEDENQEDKQDICQAVNQKYGYQKVVKVVQNPYILQKQQNQQINQKLQLFTQNKNILNKESLHNNYRQTVNQSFQEVKQAKVSGKLGDETRQSMNQTFYQSNIRNSLTVSPQKEQLNNSAQFSFMEKINNQNKQSKQQKQIISMVTGIPSNPYIILPTLKQQLMQKESKIDIENKVLSDQQLMKFQEFQDFDFNEAKKLRGISQNQQNKVEFDSKSKLKNENLSPKNTQQNFYKNKNRNFSEKNKQQDILLQSDNILIDKNPYDVPFYNNEFQNKYKGFNSSSKNKNYWISQNLSDTEYMQKMQGDQKMNQKIKKQRVHQIIKKTIDQENSILESCEKYLNLKSRKNSQFQNYIDQIKQDRPLTSEIRHKVYNPEQTQKGQSQLNKFRVLSENERKRLTSQSEELVNWYKQFLKVIEILCDKYRGNDKKIIFEICDALKANIENSYVFELFNFHFILESIENNQDLEYNNISVEAVQMIYFYIYQKKNDKMEFFIDDTESDQFFLFDYIKEISKYPKLLQKIQQINEKKQNESSQSIICAIKSQMQKEGSNNLMQSQNISPLKSFQKQVSIYSNNQNQKRKTRPDRSKTVLI